MVLNTITVSASVTPTVVKTCAFHYLNRKPRAKKPTAHISYDEGLNLIRQFLYHASFHTVEELQAFTSQWVPSPRWIRTEDVTITSEYRTRAADAIAAELGPEGIKQVGGRAWWQWRKNDADLKAEWVEMRRDFDARKKKGTKATRVMLYVHGGAYFFGSVDEHRYQLQRHARKLKARVFARMLVILRDQGLPAPAGAVLISPWVDLTHSFPSVAGDNPHDYIPAHGFMQRPSPAWPPPNADDMEWLARALKETPKGKKSVVSEPETGDEIAAQGFSVSKISDQGSSFGDEDRRPGFGHNISILIDSKMIEIRDQIQMYATNQLISHPLVSPILQPSLGGLPPLLILTGGGEMLRDEQIYLAHKAANPQKYPPGNAYLKNPASLNKFKPTNVQLQVWDDLCHVAPTLSFTRPAKFMYRSIAQFGAWALARAQKTEIEIVDDDNISVISSGSDTGSESSEADAKDIKAQVIEDKAGKAASEVVGKAGDPLPSFRHHMIRQRVDRHGIICPLARAEDLPALQMAPEDVGVIKPGPVQKWMTAKAEWDTRFASQKRKVQKSRLKEMQKGYSMFEEDEVPPPSALAGRRGTYMPKDKKNKRSWGMSLWSLWGSSHDEKTIDRESQAGNERSISVVKDDGAKGKDSEFSTGHASTTSNAKEGEEIDLAEEDVAAAEMLQKRAQEAAVESEGDPDAPAFVPVTESQANRISSADGDVTLILPGTNVTLDSPTSKRPKADGIAFPFKLGAEQLVRGGRNASTVTLESEFVGTPREEMKMPQKMVVSAGPIEATAGKDEGKEMVETEDTAESQRPNIERFETAREEL